MRSVWGWTPASSAATEITYTPRSNSLLGAITSHFPDFHVQVGARGVGGRHREGLDGLPLGGGQLGGHGHLDGDHQVAGNLLVGHAPALDAELPVRPGAGWDEQD